MVRPALAVVVTLVVLTSGCVGLFGSGETPTPVTPVPVVDQLAPGVPAGATDEASQVAIDADRLLAANDRIRANESYTLVRTVTIRGNGSGLEVRRVRRVDTDDRLLERFSANATGTRTLIVENGTLWETPSRRWVHATLSDGRTVTSEMLSLEGSPFAAARELPRRVVTGTDFAVSAPGDGAVLQSTDGVDIEESRLAVPVRDPRNASAVVVVTRDGLVEAVNLSYDATFDGRAVAVTVTHRIVDRGTTTVSRPDWVPADESESAIDDRALAFRARPPSD